MEKDYDYKKITVRGRSPEDEKSFSNIECEKLLYAQEEIEWLLNRGYNLNSVMSLVGGRYQFTARQRLALQRASSSEEKYLIRKNKLLNIDETCNGVIFIDGFNIIITLEVSLSKGTLIRCSDNVIRDLAGLRGTYKLIDKTDLVLDLLFGKVFKDLKIQKVHFYLDSPVSNSGRLKTKILNKANQWNVIANVDLVSNADVVLYNKERVVTGDSIILDKCRSWFNMVDYIIVNYLSDIQVINLNKKNS